MQKSGSALSRGSEKLRFKTFQNEEGRGSSRWAPFNEKQGRSLALSESLHDDLGTRTLSPWRGSAPFPKTLTKGGFYDVAAGFKGSPKKELLKSISSPLGDGVPFPRHTHRETGSLHHRIRSNKEGTTFIPSRKTSGTITARLCESEE